MAMSGRLTGRTSTLFRQCRSATSTPRALTPRHMSTAVSTRSLLTKAKPQQNTPYQLRLFTQSVARNEQEIAAPNANAYLESGVIKKAENRVDVKKVLVIGSGGLSIGQAGEFDYSGWSPVALAERSVIRAVTGA